MIELIQRAHGRVERTAIVSDGREYTYAHLLEASASVARQLLGNLDDLNEARVAFLLPAGFDYVAVQWGIWRAGGIAVPLCDKHPLPSIRYVLDDTNAAILVYSGTFDALLAPLADRDGLRLIRLEEMTVTQQTGALPQVDARRRAMILYTSGTTGRPKGVVTTHANLSAQVLSLVEAWKWVPGDYIVNVLPLHHVHGIVNVLCCALWSGACCEFLPKFDADEVFDRFGRGNITLFMAVPTIYHKLIARWNELDEAGKSALTHALSGLRLMVSGSAALPVRVLEEWQTVSGHTLLERYGMTEIGMAISNPYDGERRPGCIGQPLPSVQVRLAGENSEPVHGDSPGEIQVKGPTVFLEYWGNPAATSEAFTEDGWFRTGDLAVVENGSYRILGRNSVDIIKSGGYKLSALEIEEVLRTHPAVRDCAVVGIPDDTWGERVVAGLVVGGPVEPDELSRWLRDQLPDYKTPRHYLFLDELPRNEMGKVTKKELKKMFTDQKPSEQ